RDAQELAGQGIHAVGGAVGSEGDALDVEETERTDDRALAGRLVETDELIARLIDAVECTGGTEGEARDVAEVERADTSPDASQAVDPDQFVQDDVGSQQVARGGIEGESLDVPVGEPDVA